MKRFPTLFLSVTLLFSLPGCNNKQEPINLSLLRKEIVGCYQYFMDTTNFNVSSNGYGLTQDRFYNKTDSSIAATGFLLASYPVFVEESLMDYEAAKDIVGKTFDTILRMQADEETSYAGCISHFVNKSTGKRSGESEVSTIDTALLVSGAITASQYFGGELIDKANTIWGNVDYTKYQIVKIIDKVSVPCISMGVKAPNNLTQLSAWDYYAEQLMIYILGAGNPVSSHRISDTYYKSFIKKTGSYKGTSHIYSWFGSLFTYQYSHAFFNFRNYNDYRGVNYFNNSVKASKTAYQFCKDNQGAFKTFRTAAWGLTACDTPDGYSGLLGTPPRGWDGYNSGDYIRIEGTVAPTAALGSMPFTPNESYAALKYYVNNEDLFHKKYGLYDSFNLDFNGHEWIDNDFIGIDKGIEVLQLYNYINKDFVSNLSMNNPYVIEGFTNNGFVEVKK